MNKVVSLYLAQKNIPIRIDVVQGATAPSITFILEDYTPNTGAQAQIFIKKQNSEVYNSCTVSGNEVTFNPTTTSFDEVGICKAQLQITSGGKIAVSWLIYVDVTPNIIDNEAIEAVDDFSALQQAIIDVGNISEYKAQTTQNTADIANAKAKTDKIAINSATTLVTFGNSETDTVNIYGGSVNKVAIGVKNSTDNVEYRLLAKENFLNLYDFTNSRNVYTLYPYNYLPGDSLSLTTSAAVFAGHITNSSKSLDFFIPTPRQANGRTIEITITSLSVRTGAGGYVDGSQYIDLTGAAISATGSALGVAVRVTKATAYTNIPSNNTAVSVVVAATINFN